MRQVVGMEVKQAWCYKSIAYCAALNKPLKEGESVRAES